MHRYSMATMVACILLLSAITTLASAQALPSDSRNEKRTFAVADAIERNRVVTDDQWFPNAEIGTAIFSPDETRFVIRTSKGNIKRDVVEQSLLMFNTAEVYAYVQADSSMEPPKPTQIFEVDVTSENGAIQELQWIDDSNIAFIAQRPNGLAQVMKLSVITLDANEVTQSSTTITSFSVRGDLVAYYARVDTERQPSEVMQDLFTTIFIDQPDWEQTRPVQLFTTSISSGRTKKIGYPSRLQINFQKIWISPNQKHALAFVPATNAPLDWDKYQVADYETFGYKRGEATNDPTSQSLFVKTRYFIWDLDSLAGRPLLNAPSGYLSSNGTPIAAFWAEDSKSLVVTNTYLPLTGLDRDQRRSHPAIASIALDGGAVEPLIWEPASTGSAFKNPVDKIQNVAWNALRQSIEVRSGKEGEALTIKEISPTNKGWSVRRADSVAPTNRIIIRRMEDLNTPPRVYVQSSTCQCKKLLYDPDPRMEDFSFGQSRLIEWKDRNGLLWKGILIRPVNIRPGKRYPLVVQTHGARRDQFLIDGPGQNIGVTAFAAQALANVGIMVLQIQDHPDAESLTEEDGPRVAEGWRSAIKHVIENESADPEKIGLVAFSATGFAAVHLLAESPKLLKALNISDSYQPGYLQDIFSVNLPVDMANQLHAVNGGTSSEKGYCGWFSTNPLYKINVSETAVRIEAITPISAIGLWETYTVLKRANRPVDMIYFARGEHNLFKPQEKLASQEGNVDWFRYWLQGYIDPSPSKSSQYERWHKLGNGRGQ